MIEERQQVHLKRRRVFAILMIILQIIILILYGLFVRPIAHNDINKNQNFYPAYQDVNVMMLIGFGFLMTFIKNHAWSALSYTFFINAIVVQYYILLSNFWEKVFQGEWDEQTISIEQKTFTAASYSVAAMLIAFGGLLGKVGPLELLIMAIIGTVGYTLNEGIVYIVLKTFDVGGSTAIHTFGAYYGLTVSFILSKKVKPLKGPQTTYINTTIAMIGTLFLWMFWPSFNAGFFPLNPFQRTLIISNTILSLTGSCLAAFIATSFLRDKFCMDDILNATLAGGVIIGAPSGVSLNPAASLTIGLLAGFISTVGYAKLSKLLEEKIGLYDTCGINNLHGIPGLLGGILSAIVLAGYQSDPASDEFNALVAFSPQPNGRTLGGQAGIQIAATFISFGIGIGFGIIAGFIIYLIYNFEASEFFEDKHYFQVPEVEHKQFMPVPLQSRNKLPPVNKVPRGSEIVLQTKD